MVDCSGSDDVACVAVRKLETEKKTTEEEADDDGGDRLLELASGKRVAINPDWPAPSTGEYHVGQKHAFEMFTSSLKRRIKGTETRVT